MTKVTKTFDFIFPLIKQYAGNGKIRTTDLGGIRITGNCHIDWIGAAVAEDIHYELTPGTSFDAYMEWQEHMGTGCIDTAIQEHIEGILSGEIPDTTTDNQQDMPDIFEAIAKLTKPAA